MTWLKDEELPTFSFPEKGILPLSVNNVDIVINANVLFAMTLAHKQTSPGYHDAMRLLAQTIENYTWHDLSLYYPQKYIFPYAISRVWRDAGVREPLLDFSMSQLMVQILNEVIHAENQSTRPSGAFPVNKFNNYQQSTALGLITLLNLGRKMAEKCGLSKEYDDIVNKAVNFLISSCIPGRARQNKTGQVFSGITPNYWESGILYSSSLQQLAHWRSHAQTTSLVLEALAKYIDPSGLGRNFAEFMHLGDHDERLVDSGVRTSGAAIETCLGDHASHVQTVVSKYLRGQFGDLRDYNQHAGDMAEPYRLIVVADYPRQFSEMAAQSLLSIAENGSRAGVHVLIVRIQGSEDPRDVPFERLAHGSALVSLKASGATVRLGAQGPRLTFLPDTCPPLVFSPQGEPTSRAAELLDSMGAASARRAESNVTLASFLRTLSRNRAGATPDQALSEAPITMSPESWWSSTTIDTAVAPIGRTGAVGVASAYFSSTDIAGGAIVVGLPRSGKTTALHAMILTMTMLYSPEELELYLIDAKHGVEFKQYESLPHARMVSIHSDREFSVAILKSLQREIRDRAEWIKNKAPGLSNVTEFRRATAERMPRIVAVIDEFHELFEEADALGYEAMAAFNDIVRMGPFSGVHVVVASQTLSSMPAMDRQVLTLLPQRIAFMCNEYDAEIVMGDANPGPRLLGKTGDGLFNPARGEEAKNQFFRGLYVDPPQRRAIVEQLHKKAAELGWTRSARVFDGHQTVPRPPLADLVKRGGRLTIPLGEPFSLAMTESVQLQRTQGSNLMVVGDRADEDQADHAVRGVIHSVLSAAAAQSATVSIVDFMGQIEDDTRLTIQEAGQLASARYCRGSRFAEVLGELAAEVAARTSAEDYSAPTHLLILVGIQRALSLKPDPYGYAVSDELSAMTLFSDVLRMGPEVGIHVILDADSAQTIEARIGRELADEFALRVTGSTANLADVSLVTGSYGRPEIPSNGQLLIGDVFKGRVVRVRGYDIPVRSSK